LPRLLRT